jgi:hypothetical protein
MPSEVVHRGHAAADKRRSTDDSASSVDTSQFLRQAQAHQSLESDSDGASSRPIVTQLPEGYTVVEQRVGRATAQWLLHVRCECGQHWFEGDAKQNTRCPACGRLIRLDIQSRG